MPSITGQTVFEGIRGNWNAEEKQTYIFRAREHLSVWPEAAAF